MTDTSFDGRFEWDSEKNAINKRKHGLSFEEILPMFDDPFFLERFDYNHSDDSEDRMFGLGSVNGIVIIAVAFAERTRIRIISARLASPMEEKVYYENYRRFNS